MIPILLALVMHTSQGGPVIPGDDDAPAWAPIVAYDEVRVDADTARVSGSGPYTLWLRWSFLERASSPQAWDAGVRSSVDLVEVDCARQATRTFSSLAYRADGSAIAAASFDEPAAQWHVARPQSVAAEITEQVCGLARRGR